MKALDAEVLRGARRVHLLGVGGIGVQVLAELLLEGGRRVTGTDRAASPTLARLADLGVEVAAGERPDWAAAADLLVYTSAAPEDHPERVAARQAGVPEAPRGACLGGLAAGREVIAIAGAHGKTTTTTMTARMLEAAGLDPSAAVGGVVHAWGSPARRGQGAAFVAEADESDRSFLALPAAIAVALNVDRDHLENYADGEDLDRCFLQYLGGARQAAVVWMDDPRLAALVEGAGWVAAAPGGAGAGAAAAEGARLAAPPELVRVGTDPGCELVTEDLRVEDGRVRFTARWRGESLGEVVVNRPGLHDGGNAACALAAGLLAGAAPGPLIQALADFEGPDRRFSRRGRAGGVEVVDDYAHMPTELAATLAAARAAYPDRRLVAVFQPHLYSRTQAYAAEFAAALAAADRGLVLPIYGAREDPVAGVDAALVAGAAEGLEVLDVADPEEAGRQLAAELGPGDLVLTLGAGSVTRMAPALLRALRRRGALDELASRCAVVRADEPLSRYSFFQIGGPADLYLEPADEAELAAALAWLAENEVPFKVLSGGSNVLISDQGFRGAVLRLGAGFKAFEVEDDGVTVRAGAALPMGVLHTKLAAAGVGGLECCHHIPGLLGGALVNNSGAYGQEVGQRLVSLTLVDHEGVREVPADQLDIRYRHTALKGQSGVVVTAGRLRGEAADPDAIRAEARRQAAERNRTQPAGRGSAGCAFQNPGGGKGAGQLIDEAGCKGMRVGGARVSEKHGNYLMNEGGATAADVRQLMEAVRARVREAHGVGLQLEVELLGEFAPVLGAAAGAVEAAPHEVDAVQAAAAVDEGAPRVAPDGGA